MKTAKKVAKSISKQAEFLIILKHEDGWYDIFLNGECVYQVEKEETLSEVLFDVDNVEEWEKVSGVKRKNFLYTLWDLPTFCYKQNISFNHWDYMDRNEVIILDKVNTLNVVPDFSNISMAEFKEKRYE